MTKSLVADHSVFCLCLMWLPFLFLLIDCLQSGSGLQGSGWAGLGWWNWAQGFTCFRSAQPKVGWADSPKPKVGWAASPKPMGAHGLPWADRCNHKSLIIGYLFRIKWFDISLSFAQFHDFIHDCLLRTKLLYKKVDRQNGREHCRFDVHLM